MAALCVGSSVQAQNGFLTFSNTSGNTTASTSNTGFSGVRTGTGGGGFTIVNPGEEIGTQAEIRGVAPTSASINSIGISSAEYGTAAQTFTVSFDVYFTGGSSGTWYFFAGNGATFGASQSSSFSSTQVFTGLRMVYGSSSAITTNYRNSSGSWVSTGISGTPFAQNVAYTVTIVGNNTGSTVNYGASQSVASNTFDFWVNGTLVGNDLSKAQLGGTTDINAFRFYGESSTSNVATIFLDNIKWWNTCEPPAISVFSGISSVPANTYSDVFINNGTASLAGNVTVNNTLFYTSGTLNLNSNTLSYASGATLNFTPASAAATSTNSIFPAAGGPANLTINNANGVTLHDSRTITGTLNLTNGILNTSSNSITYGTLSGGSISSYIVGNQIYSTTATTPVTFHCGASGNARTVTLTPTSTAATSWQIRYVRANGQTAFGTTLGSGLNSISDVEYYVIDRLSGTSDATVQLSFSGNSGVQNLSDLRVVRWDGSQWMDHGNGGTTGTTSSGTVSSSAAVTSFSPFTIGSAAATNPLPVEWWYVKAVLTTTGQAHIQWATTTETNNAGFTVEWSADMKIWSHISSHPGARNSNIPKHYEAFSELPLGYHTHYFRIKQTDFDGSVSYSNVVSVSSNAKNHWAVVNPVNEEVVFMAQKGPMNQPSTAVIFNSTGEEITRVNLSSEGTSIPCGHWKPGVYMILLSSADGSEAIRIIKN